ncbi:MAG: hypothetical protein KME46_29860 [Brasilonema angustatum HA4187-MV1]|jgi:hypothetical protein|nr:hypothetical protein [Brasilonema angustatum HA4187-MV1]
MEELIKLLSEQNKLLKQLVESTSKRSLGFNDRPPGLKEWVFVGRNGNDCLYKLDSKNQQVIMKQKSFTGYIIHVAVDKVMRRNKETEKLNITLQAGDDAYVLSSGLDTCFSKSLLGSLLAIENISEQLLTLAFVPGDDESIVWCRVYAPNYIKAPLVESEQLLPCAQMILEKFDASKPKNILPFVQPKQVLYPQHNAFIKRLRAISGHEPAWIVAQCRAYGGEQPGHLAPDKLRKLVYDMAGDFGFSQGIYYTRQLAAQSYQDKVTNFEAAGQRWGEGVLAWFHEVKNTASAG